MSFPKFVMLLLLLIPLARADFVIDTTAGFDAGLKSSSSGNYEVETITDNSANAANLLLLANKYGDNMNFSDADGLTWKWENDPVWSATATPYARDIDTTTNDRYYLRVSPTGSTDYGYRGSRLTSKMSGNYDVRINLDWGASTSGNNIMGIFAYKDASNYARIYIRRPASGSATIVAVVYEGGVVSGTATYTLTAPDYYLSFRIARTSSDTITLYYDLAQGDSWTQLLQVTSWLSDDHYFGINVYRGVTAGTASTFWWRYKLNAGGFDANPYRASGNWTSTSQDLGEEYLSGLNITTTFANATNYVDKIEILDASDDSVITTYNGDITTATTTSLTGADFTAGLDGTDKKTIKVRMFFVGDGIGSPIVSAVSGTAETLPDEENDIVLFIVTHKKKAEQSADDNTPALLVCGSVAALMLFGTKKRGG